ncbi:MAG: hypothetical protein UT50_C0001G0089 [Candidatus Moranbacteria bacterium GW2011_GWA2_39_41]|nr:MAG: hypothetical protein UT50_C0001G0089 [Candidatus Moranbacteria bacterium GW2011_GWA2_39_41]
MTPENKPLVTVVTITFNLIKAGREKYFRQCLESVYNQSYDNIEHIIIDGASSDGTVDLIKEYVDKGWIKYISESDTGIYDAMNKGAKMANGEYVAFLNSDDFYYDNYGIEKSIDELESSNADFSYASANILRENGSLYSKHPHTSPDISTIFFIMPFCHQTMVARKNILIKEGFFDVNFKSAGDYELLIRLCLKQYKSVFIDSKFVTFRWGGFSISNNDLSINEVADAYYKNYSKITNITKERCAKIYCSGYESFPRELANKLVKHNPYFNYRRYIEEISYKNSFRYKFLKTYSLIYSKISFIIFFPKKFINKYLNKFLNSRLRQPARKIWYAIRFKNIIK